MTLINRINAYKPTFRAVHDYLERQLEKMPAYASAEKYWAQAWADMMEQLDDENEFRMDLFAAAYWELEREWKRREGK